MEGRTDGPTDGPTDRQTDGPTEACEIPNRKNKRHFDVTLVETTLQI